jgi:cobalt/nickel transport system permease protein
MSAAATALELAVSGTSPIQVALPAMTIVHVLIGAGEGLITVGALAFLAASRRDLVGQPQQPVSRAVWGIGLALALALAVLSPLASSFPDGLEWVAQQNDFLTAAQDAPFRILPDYVFPGIASPELATIAAGIVGTLLVFAVALAVAFARRGRSAANA